MLIRLGFLLAAERQLERHFGNHVGDVGRAFAHSSHRGRARQHQLLRVGARNAFARVFAQCVRDFVASTVASSASDNRDFR